MDGDSLGSLCRDLSNLEAGVNPLSEALTAFTSGAKAVVHEHDGVVIYAGGDDLLAMLPMTTALRCAAEVSNCYQCAFRGVLGEERYGSFQTRATISAGLVFAHNQAPLHTMLQEAHHLLDDVAKDTCGRDSIAISVWKPSGKMCQYSSTWRYLQAVRPVTVGGQALRWNESEPVTQIEQLAALFKERDRGSAEGFSSSFVYRLREQLGLLCAWPHWEPGVFGSLESLGDGFDNNAFLSAEVIRCLRIAGYSEDDIALDEVKAQTDLLLRASQRSFRKASGSSFSYETQAHEVGMDAAMLARFLARGGVRDE